MLSDIMRNGWQGLSWRRCVTTMAMFGWVVARPRQSQCRQLWQHEWQSGCTSCLPRKILLLKLCHWQFPIFVRRLVSWTIDFLPQHFLLCFAFLMLWKKNYLLYGQTGVSMSCSRTIKFTEIYCRNFYYCCVRRNKVFMVKSIQVLYPVLHESDINPFNLHKPS